MNSITGRELKSIQSIILSINTEQSILNQSVQEVTTASIQKNTLPVVNGVNSAKFGPPSSVRGHQPCETCGLVKDCPTHPGHIALTEYVILPYCYNTIESILSVVCIHCGKIIKDNSADDAAIEYARNLSNRSRLPYLKKVLKKIKECNKPGYGCSAIRVDVKKVRPSDGPLDHYDVIYGGYKNQKEDEEDEKKVVDEKLYARDVFQILKRITDDTWDLLGFDPKFFRPEDMIIRNLAVPARAVRPTNVTPDGLENQDDLTHFLVAIVQKNLEIQSSIEKGAPDEKVRRAADWLNRHVNIMFNSNSKDVPMFQKNDKKKMQSYNTKLDKKEGLFRKNLLAKRVKFSARSVITGIPIGSIGDVYIPRTHAMTLDFPERVTEENIERLRGYVANGVSKYPGANRVKLNNKQGSTVSLKYAKSQVELEPGMIVYRHVLDGDYMLLNRQPTLHKDGIQGMRVRVRHDAKTISFSVISTVPFKADKPSELSI